jgi:hypothetical protein
MTMPAANMDITEMVLTHILVHSKKVDWDTLPDNKIVYHCCES